MATSSKNSQGNRPAGITCSHYEAIPGRKHCRHYLQNGSCSRPDELMCTEWLKANGHRAKISNDNSSINGRSQDRRRKLSTSSPVDLFGNPNPDYVPASKEQGNFDLFGNPVPKPKRSPTQQRPTAAMVSPAPTISQTTKRQEPLGGLSAKDIESFKSLNIEVCMTSEDFGEMWLVPTYTGKDRQELTAEHAATICQLLQAFPSSKVTAFEKTSAQKENSK